MCCKRLVWKKKNSTCSNKKYKFNKSEICSNFWYLYYYYYFTQKIVKQKSQICIRILNQLEKIITAFLTHTSNTHNPEMIYRNRHFQTTRRERGLLLLFKKKEGGAFSSIFLITEFDKCRTIPNSVDVTSQSSDQNVGYLFLHIVIFSWPSSCNFTLKLLLPTFESFASRKKMGHIAFTVT